MFCYVGIFAKRSIQASSPRTDTGFLFSEINMEKILKLKDLYPTSQFPVAVTLLYFGVPLQAFERDHQSSQKIIFLFKRIHNLDEILKNFWEDTLQVSPKRWHALSRELKSRVRSELAYEADSE